MTFQPIPDDVPAEYRNVILRVEAGSTLHGIDLPGGDDDRDETAVCIEPRGWVTGISRPPGRDGAESLMYRTAAEGERSGPGDLDLTVHGLRKFARLAAAGNPSILQTFFVPAERRETGPLGQLLLDARSAFVSRAAGWRYAGYLRQQRGRYERPERAGRSRGVREGRGPKYAAHMIRLGFQGVELLEYGQVTLPMPEHQREYVLEVRDGAVGRDEILHAARSMETRLEELASAPCALPREPDHAAISELLHDLHLAAWREEDDAAKVRRLTDQHM